MTVTRIAELSSIIAANTAQIDSYLTNRGLPTPSFDANVAPGLFATDCLAPARQAVLEATYELHGLMQGPILLLMDHAHSLMTSLQAIYRFNIATSFPHGKDRATYKEISSACGIAESFARRILRSAMAHHLFREPTPGVVAHTAASKVLAENPLMHQWLGMVSEELWPAATRTVDAIAKWPGSQEPNHAGFNIAHDTGDHCFTSIAKSPARSQRFAEAMKLFRFDDGYAPDHLLDNYPWAAIGAGVVVDVGGAQGAYSIPIAQRFPDLHCIIQDRAEVVGSHAQDVPPELTDRVTFMTHDFFTEQPVKDADVYLFRWVFHDWSDKYSIRILRALVPALKEGARIVIHEYILSEPGVLPSYQERTLRTFDLHMMALLNAKEREAEDWVSLFRNADPRFDFLGITQPPSSKLGIIEARWRGT
ncbi:hypothetical protein MMC07_003522 [Pseudocyphellaria aurata]|nr:hypothetical protein [Pseudocyphellaria aurata]